MRLDAVSDAFQWCIPNRAGHVRMLTGAGFLVERLSRPYSIPFGHAHPPGGEDRVCWASAPAGGF